MLRSANGKLELLTPMLVVLAVLPWIWALPSLHKSPLQLQLSGAPLVTLMLGWPLAVPVLLSVGVFSWLVSNMPLSDAVALMAWHGVVPASFALILGAALRRWLPHQLFVYVLGRGFIGTMLCLFGSSLLAQALGHELPHVTDSLSRVALWLMAWGDAFLTGMTCAIFVAYRPQWLATWSDELYCPSPKTR